MRRFLGVEMQEQIILSVNTGKSEKFRRDVASAVGGYVDGDRAAIPILTKGADLRALGFRIR